tara:strand:- start:322 stop:639 length:318 start_codon:yes stop_codon:yes gene_type:complete
MRVRSHFYNQSLVNFGKAMEELSAEELQIVLGHLRMHLDVPQNGRKQQAVQGAIGVLNAQQKGKHEDQKRSFEKAFMDSAKTMLSEDIFHAIMNAVRQDLNSADP